MTANRGAASAIIGKSTHNQRIERLWRDVFSGSLQYFYDLFYYMKDDGKLDHLNEAHLFALQYVYKPRIDKSLQEWSTAWASHRLRTAKRTPLQLWLNSQIENPVSIEESETCQPERDEEQDEEFPRISIQVPRNPLDENTYLQLCEEINPLHFSSEHGIDVYQDVIRFIHTNT